MSTLNQSPPINNEEFISLAERVTSKLQSLDSRPNSSSEAKVKQVAQNTIKLCHELLVQADDVLKLQQLGSLNGVPEQINVTSQESIGPLSIDSGLEEILPSFSSVIQNRYRQHTSTHRPQRYNIQPIQQKLLYIGINTVNAIKEEVLALGLPTTLENISLAIQSSEKILNAFVNGGIIQAGEEVQATQKDEFQSVCSSLVSRGAAIELTSWEEVEEKLSEVFLFFRTIRPLPMNRQARPLRQRGSTANTCLSISAYKQMMKDKMGAGRFERIFNQAAAIKSYDEFAKDIDR